MAMGGLSTKGRGRAGMHEINVTPLIDVMLVLLVIFMVTAPLLTAGVSVELPKTAATQGLQDPDPLTLSITQEGRVYLGKEEITEAIGMRLQQDPRVRQGKELAVQGDARVPYGTVLRVMAEARQAGVEKLGMMTEPLVSTP